ncbi:MAG: hypothetical protein RIR79_1929 [Pseudomonadota bacterium]|jgi:alpha-ribazole phosphatase
MILIRHARPLIASGICYGALNVLADAESTQKAAMALAKNLPQGAIIVHSPLQRCEQLMHALQAFRPDLIAKPDCRLREMDFGIWEGKRWDEIPRTELEAWTDSFFTYRCGGGENVESFMARVAAAWDENGEIWITHAGVIRAVMLLAQGKRQIHRADEWPQVGVGFGEWLAT